MPPPQRPRDWVAWRNADPDGSPSSRLVPAADYRTEIQDYVRAMPQYIARTRGGLFIAAGPQTMFELAPPSTPMLLRHSGTANTDPHWSVIRAGDISGTFDADAFAEPEWALGNLGDGTIPADRFAAGVLDIPDGSLTTEKYADGSFTGPKFAAGALTPPDGSLTTEKFADGSFTGPKFAAGALTPPDGSLTTEKFADGSITPAKLAGGTAGTFRQSLSGLTAADFGGRLGSYRFTVSGIAQTVTVSRFHIIQIASTVPRRSGIVSAAVNLNITGNTSAVSAMRTFNINARVTSGRPGTSVAVGSVERVNSTTLRLRLVVRITNSFSNPSTAGQTVGFYLSGWNYSSTDINSIGPTRFGLTAAQLREYAGLLWTFGPAVYQRPAVLLARDDYWAVDDEGTLHKYRFSVSNAGEDVWTLIPPPTNGWPR